jgi:hypothetical protein
MLNMESPPFVRAVDIAQAFPRYQHIALTLETRKCGSTCDTGRAI